MYSSVERGAVMVKKRRRFEAQLKKREALREQDTLQALASR